MTVDDEIAQPTSWLAHCRLPNLAQIDVGGFLRVDVIGDPHRASRGKIWCVEHHGRLGDFDHGGGGFRVPKPLPARHRKFCDYDQSGSHRAKQGGNPTVKSRRPTGPVFRPLGRPFRRGLCTNGKLLAVTDAARQLPQRIPSRPDGVAPSVRQPRNLEGALRLRWVGCIETRFLGFTYPQQWRSSRPCSECDRPVVRGRRRRSEGLNPRARWIGRGSGGLSASPILNDGAASPTTSKLVGISAKLPREPPNGTGLVVRPAEEEP